MSETPSSESAVPPPHRHGRDLTTGSILHHMIAFSLPMLLGSAAQTAYGFINMIWVGRYLGETSLAAATDGMTVFFLLAAIGAGLTLASNILVSQHYGARDFVRLRKVVDSSAVMIELFSVTILVVGEICAPRVLRVMNTPSDVFGPAVSYLRVFLLGLPFGFGMFLVRSMLQGIGDSKTPLYALSASLVLNAILDPVLIFGLGGFPKLGLNGTAWASGFSQLAALTWLLIYMRRRKSLVALSLRGLQFDWETAWTTVRIGVPSAVQQSLIALGMLVVVSIVGSFGETALAAYGVATRIDQLAFMPAMTFSMAISTIAGQNIGAGKHHRVREVFIWGSILSGGITIAASMLVVLMPDVLLRIFAEGKPNVITLGVGYLRVVGACYVFFAIMFVTNGIINGAGHTFMTTVISLISLWAVRLPLAYLLAHRMHSVVGVWYALSISFAVSMLISLAYYLSGRWRRPIAGRTPMPPEPVTE